MRISEFMNDRYPREKEKMKNRLCPNEETLSEYISGTLPAEKRLLIEKHLAVCRSCRTLLAETHDITRKSASGKMITRFSAGKREVLWLTACLITFSASFLFSKFFLQFLAVSFLLGIKWILDAKTTKTLIMIHKTLKAETKTDKEKTFIDQKQSFMD